jgi:hypothetical protein
VRPLHEQRFEAAQRLSDGIAEKAKAQLKTQRRLQVRA